MARIFNFIDGFARSRLPGGGPDCCIAALILAEIFSRAVLNLSLSFAWEYAAYFMGAAVFWRPPSPFARAAMCVSFVEQRPGEVAKAIDATLFAAAIAVYVAYALLAAWQAHSPAAPRRRLTRCRWSIHGVMAIGALLLAVQHRAGASKPDEPAPEDAEARRIFGVE